MLRLQAAPAGDLVGRGSEPGTGALRPDSRSLGSQHGFTCIILQESFGPKATRQGGILSENCCFSIPLQPEPQQMTIFIQRPGLTPASMEERTPKLPSSSPTHRTWCVGGTAEETGHGTGGSHSGTPLGSTDHGFLSLPILGGDCTLLHCSG